MGKQPTGVNENVRQTRWEPLNIRMPDHTTPGGAQQSETENILHGRDPLQRKRINQTHVWPETYARGFQSHYFVVKDDTTTYGEKVDGDIMALACRRSLQCQRQNIRSMQKLLEHPRSPFNTSKNERRPVNVGSDVVVGLGANFSACSTVCRYSIATNYVSTVQRYCTDYGYHSICMT